MEKSKETKVTITMMNASDVKKISNEGVVIKRKYGEFKREIVSFDTVTTPCNDDCKPKSIHKFPGII